VTLFWETHCTGTVWITVHAVFVPLFSARHFAFVYHFMYRL